MLPHGHVCPLKEGDTRYEFWVSQIKLHRWGQETMAESGTHPPLLVISSTVAWPAASSRSPITTLALDIKIISEMTKVHIELWAHVPSLCKDGSSGLADIGGTGDQHDLVFRHTCEPVQL